jgi:hypothetical protein
MFLMTTPNPGIAAPASLPPPVSSRSRAKPDPAARRRRLVGGWLRQLGDIGVQLVAGIRQLARVRAAAGGQDEVAPIDLNLGWVLVRRATRWMAALRFRVAAEAAAARLKNDPVANPDPVSTLDAMAQMIAGVEADVKTTLHRLQAAEAPKPATVRVERHEVRHDACIDGIPTSAVLAQVCADLGAASTVLIEPDARRLIEGIAAEARAMLGETSVALLPVPRVIGRSYAVAPPQASMAGVAAPPAAPGTG